MNKRAFPSWIWALALATALLSLFSIFQRSKVESQNHTVAFAVEMENVQALAGAQGITVPEALERLKKSGVQAIVLSEETVGQLISEGRASEISGKLTISDPSVRPRVQRGLSLRIPHQDPSTVPVWMVRTTAIGLDPIEAQQARDHGMQLIARCSNVVGATNAYVAGTLAWAHELGATYFLPSGDQVIGRRTGLTAAVETMRSLGMRYATPEFAKISGDENIVQSAPEIVVRLHTAQNAELDKMTIPDAVERYTKAARERNMRLLLIRPLSLAGNQPVDDFGAFVSAIHDGVAKEGFNFGVPQPFRDAGIPKVLPALIALTVVPLAFWLGGVLLPWKWAPFATAAFMLLLAAVGITKTGAQLGALAASMAFPIAALISLDMRKLSHPALDFLTTTLLSLVGGLAIAGMLNGLPYYVRAETFPGVKLSVFLPLAIAAVYYFWALTRARDEIRSPITWNSAILGMVILGAIAFMIARTGNDSPTGVSSFELQFRNILDKLLIVRPRTKEFLIGHPAMVIAIGLLMAIKRNPERAAKLGSWTTLAVMLGAIGQTSVVNTMCHLHTPVLLSLARIGEGVVIGCIIGLALWALLKRYALGFLEHA